MYEASCRKKLVQLSLIVVEETYCEIWREWYICMVPKWEILKKIYTTIANCILSEKVKTLILLLLAGIIENFKNSVHSISCILIDVLLI